MNQQEKEDYQEQLENLSDMQLLTCYKEDVRAGFKEQAAITNLELIKRGLD